MTNEIDDLINELFKESGLPLSEENNFKNDFIKQLSENSLVASEFGYNDSDFCFDTNDFHEQVYNLYCREQQACKQSLSSYLREDDDDDIWASYGNMGGLQWLALTNYYNPSVHKISEVKYKSNQKFREIVRSEDLEDYFGNAINNSEQFANFYYIFQKNPLIFNLSTLGNDDKSTQWVNFHEVQILLELFLKRFFECDNEENAVNKINDQLIFNESCIKGRDILFVAPVLAEGDVFKMIGQNLLKNGAATVSGIFITRLKPTIAGIYPKDLGDEYIRPLYPRISINLKGIFGG